MEQDIESKVERIVKLIRADYAGDKDIDKINIFNKPDKAIVIEEKLFGDCFETQDQQAAMNNFLEKDKTKKLNEILDTDEGARYVGEFSLGFNPKVIYPMGDILYDEKILGSIHFTPGQAYKDCYNGNDSGIHWDMVLIQRKDYGGGEIYFDDVLIRKDGVFVLKELEPLNFDYRG